MSVRRRRHVHAAMGWLMALAAGAVVLPLLLIFAFLLYQGATALNVDFFTHLPKPVGEPGGGMANAILGTLILLGLAAALGLPLGILGGVYLAESRDHRLPWFVRFLADVLNGVPSIVIGLFAYTVVVLPMRRFSALAGGFALAVIMIPIVLRTTEEILRLVPASLREAALALGIPEWKVILRVVLPTARAGIVTGVIGRRGPDRRGDGAAPLHRLRQPLLASASRPAHRGAAAADLRVGDLAVRRLAPAGVGRGAGPDRDGVPGEPGRAAGDTEAPGCLSGGRKRL